MAGDGALVKCCKIRHIVRLRQMLRRWRTRAATSSSRAHPPPADVPAGHVAVCVGSTSRRFIVRTTHLNHPMFRTLLAEAEEAYGYSHAGPIAIPCEESAFEDVLRHICTASCRCSCCHVARRGQWRTESLPLLSGFVEKSVW